jgi:hypothetical protein
MSVAIRIDDELYEEAKRSAEAECRTVPLQGRTDGDVLHFFHLPLRPIGDKLLSCRAMPDLMLPVLFITSWHVG